MLKKLFSDSLFHFVLVGALLYYLIDFASPDLANFDANNIEISNQDLLVFMQNRDQVFNEELYTQKFSSQSETERQNLIDLYVEQEVLIREAQNLGLDQDDEITRRRLIQKLIFFLEGLAPAESQLSTEDLKQYFEVNKEDFRRPQTITFKHIFFNASTIGDNDAMVRAKDSLASLSDISEDTEPSGDRFYYDRNYVDKSQTQVAQHFGNEFARAVFTLKPQNNGQESWQGPFASAYGQHLVLIIDRTDSDIPSFDEITQQIESDAQRFKKIEARNRQISQLVEKYKVVTE